MIILDRLYQVTIFLNTQIMQLKFGFINTIIDKNIKATKQPPYLVWKIAAHLVQKKQPPVCYNNANTSIHCSCLT